MPTDHQSPPSGGARRDEFEADVITCGRYGRDPTERHGEGYLLASVQERWKGWQAALSHLAPASMQTAEPSSEFTTTDADLNRLLDLTHAMAQPDAGGHDLGMAWLEACERVESRLLASTASPHPAEPWRTAIDEALVNCGLDCLGPDEDARAALKRLIAWEVTIATDPAVSDAAPRDSGGALPELPPLPAVGLGTTGSDFSSIQMRVYAADYALAAIAADRAKREPLSEEQEREAFETWCRAQPGHPFAGVFTTLMRKAWNARAQASRAAVPEGWRAERFEGSQIGLWAPDGGGVVVGADEKHERLIPSIMHDHAVRAA